MNNAATPNSINEQMFSLFIVIVQKRGLLDRLAGIITKKASYNSAQTGAWLKDVVFKIEKERCKYKYVLTLGLTGS